MSFKSDKKQPQFADLKGVLAQSKQTDNALYQTVQILIDRLTQFQNITVKEVKQVQSKLGSALAVPPVSGKTITIVVREIPGGSINGSNTVFTLANTPVVDSEQVYLNGLLQDTRGIDYSLSGAVLTFLIPPVPGDRVLVTYQRA